MSHWIVIADGARARFYAADDINASWRLLRTLAHAESREKNVELTPTEPGRALKSKGGVRHSSFQPRTEPHEVEERRFAQEVAAALAHADRAREYDKLVLVAPPRFLGLLREELPDRAARRAEASLDRDYMPLDDVEARERVLAELARRAGAAS